MTKRRQGRTGCRLRIDTRLKALMATATQITAEISPSVRTAWARAYSRSAVSCSGNVVVISARRSAACSRVEEFGLAPLRQRGELTGRHACGRSLANMDVQARGTTIEL